MQYTGAAAVENAAAPVHRELRVIKCDHRKIGDRYEIMWKQGGRTRNPKTIQAVGWMLVLTVLFLALLVRVPYGFDWTDESYHVENDYLFQLNPLMFNTIPNYVISECDQAVSELEP